MFFRTISALVIVLILIGGATAEMKNSTDTSFCPTAAKPESDTCKSLKLFNRSNDTVKAINIIQQPNEAGCTKDERRYTKNLEDETIRLVTVNPTCKYKIRFKTSSRCSGDSTAYMTPRKFAENKNTVYLKGNCKNLKTEVGYYAW